MSAPRHILFVIHEMTAGGAERVASLLANAWVERGVTITLATLSDDAEATFFPLDPRVRRLALGTNGNPGPLLRRFGALGRNIARVREIRRAIRATRADVVLSFIDITNVLSIVAATGTGVPVVATEHIDPAMQDIGRLWTTLRRWTYPHAGRVAMLNERALAFFPPDIRANSVVVPNPVVAPPPGPPAPRPPAGKRRMIALGRLHAQKGFDLLLEAFAAVAPRHPAWSLEIWGEGPAHDALAARAARPDLAGRVRLAGRTSDAYGVLRAADLYVLSSRFEGFPMVLCEAMACGLPVVAFDCRTGPREIVRDGVDGLLVPDGDTRALAAALDRVLADDALRARLAARAPELVERFSMSRVLARWDEVFEGLGRR